MLEIYKLHAELADRVSQRREAASRLHIGLLSGLGLFAGVFPEFVDLEALTHTVFLAVGILGMAISFSWWVVMGSYRQLNDGKFEALQELEEKIAFPFFTREWEILGKGTKPRRYRKLTAVETILPIAFGVLSLGLTVIQAHVLIAV